MTQQDAWDIEIRVSLSALNLSFQSWLLSPSNPVALCVKQNASTSASRVRGRVGFPCFLDLGFKSFEAIHGFRG